MNFYSAMQMDTIGLKRLIQTATTKKEKRKYQFAFLLKNVLCALFAVVFIVFFNTFFGNNNSAVAVVIFCTLLSLRFVDFGYSLIQSIFSLFIIFFIMAIGTHITQYTGLLLSVLLNFIFIFIIVILTCHNLLYSNHSIFVFGYLLIQGNPVSGKDFRLRIMEMFIGFLLCAIILYRNHRKTKYYRTLKYILKEFHLTSFRSQWQLRISLGITFALFLGQVLHLPRIMWIGIGAMSVLQPFSSDVKFRFSTRIPFTIIGSIFFVIVYSLVPDSFHSTSGVFFGIVLGFCATYQWKTVFNCFGALLMASSIYSLPYAVIFRIINNIIGCSFSYFFHSVFQKGLMFLLSHQEKHKDHGFVDC